MSQKIADMHQFRIMTFNLRFENDIDGSNAWFIRKELILKVIKNYSPSILGTQEGRPSQLEFLNNQLSEYIPNIPISRRYDPTCQYPTLYIKEDIFEVLETGEFWLSSSPHVHRSKDWDSAFPRMINYARIRPWEGTVTFWVAVTHLDNKGVLARKRQAEMIAKWMRDKTEGVILMGDFNDEPDSEVHRILKSSCAVMKDTWESVIGSGGSASFTYHGFTGIPCLYRMDWILVSEQFQVVDVKIIKDDFDGRYPSDHFPYVADVKIPESISQTDRKI
jgi:endonuclease/exonuclease/phosphatase family metal-dependent hydrolase